MSDRRPQLWLYLVVVVFGAAIGLTQTLLLFGFFGVQVFIPIEILLHKMLTRVGSGKRYGDELLTALIAGELIIMQLLQLKVIGPALYAAAVCVSVQLLRRGRSTRGARYFSASLLWYASVVLLSWINYDFLLVDAVILAAFSLLSLVTVWRTLSRLRLNSSIDDRMLAAAMVQKGRVR